MALTINRTLDNAQIIDFLTSSAGVLAEHQQISNKDCDNLRIAISSANIERIDQGLLLQLFQQKNELVGTLLNRYGVSGLIGNISSYCLRPILSELLGNVDQTINQLLDGAKLYFNRYFYLYFHEDTPKKRVVMSTFLVATAQQLMDCRVNISKTADDTFLFLPHKMVDYDDHHRQIDESISHTLGFNSINQRLILGSKDEIGIALKHELESLHRSLCRFVEHVNRNTAETIDLTLDLEIQLGILAAEIQKLHMTSGFDHPSLVALETNRINRLDTLTKVAGLFGNISAAIARIIGHYKNCIAKTPIVPPMDLQRSLAAGLIARQVSPDKAVHAVASLVSYCTRKGINPSQLILAELVQIHPQLTENLHILIQHYYRTETQSPLYNLEKDQTLLLSKNIKDRLFSIATVGAATALFCLIFSLGCGIKTAPRSDVLDIRPPLPSTKVDSPSTMPSSPDHSSQNPSSLKLKDSAIPTK